MHVKHSLPARLVIVTAVGLAGASTGTVAATSEPPADTPASSAAGAPAGPGCAEISALLDGQGALFNALFAEDADAIGTVVESLPALAQAATAAAPAEIAETVGAFVSPIDGLVAALEGVDFTDPDAIGAAFNSLPPTPQADAAIAPLQAWAAEQCAWQSAMIDPFADAPEPPECDVLDPAVAADAAGVAVDVADSDGSGDFKLPGFWTKSCSYGDGAMALSTLSFNELDAAIGFYMDNLDAGEEPGEVLDVDLGTLPASSLVTRVSGSTTVSVFEASVPFSVAFTTPDIDPAAVVAAAEAVNAGLPDEPVATSSPAASTATSAAPAATAPAPETTTG